MKYTNTKSRKGISYKLIAIYIYTYIRMYGIYIYRTYANKYIYTIYTYILYIYACVKYSFIKVIGSPVTDTAKTGGS